MIIARKHYFYSSAAIITKGNGSRTLLLGGAVNDQLVIRSPATTPTVLLTCTRFSNRFALTFGLQRSHS